MVQFGVLKVGVNWEVLDIGTPQGSVRGPFMFIVYRNFILQNVCSMKHCEVITYADDTSLLFEVVSWMNLREYPQR